MAARKDKPALLEWVAATIGLAIFIGLFGTIFVQTDTDDRTPISDLVVEHQRIFATSGGTHVIFDIRNQSDKTAAAVVIKGRMLDGAAEVASSDVTIDYVPARSRVRAGLMFRESPRGRRIEVRAVGYREP